MIERDVSRRRSRACDSFRDLVLIVVSGLVVAAAPSAHAAASLAAPENIAMGMPVAEAVARLQAAGYTPSRAYCRFSRKSDQGTHNVELSLRPPQAVPKPDSPAQLAGEVVSGCPQATIVVGLEYSEVLAGAARNVDPPAELESLAANLGNYDACASLGPNEARACVWRNPGFDPKISTLTLSLRKPVSREVDIRADLVAVLPKVARNAGQIESVAAEAVDVCRNYGASSGGMADTFRTLYDCECLASRVRSAYEVGLIEDENLDDTYGYTAALDRQKEHCAADIGGLTEHFEAECLKTLGAPHQGTHQWALDGGCRCVGRKTAEQFRAQPTGRGMLGGTVECGYGQRKVPAEFARAGAPADTRTATESRSRADAERTRAIPPVAGRSQYEPPPPTSREPLDEAPPAQPSQAHTSPLDGVHEVLEISIGTPLDEAQRRLVALGYRQAGQCGFVKGTQGVGGRDGASILLSTNRSSGTGCNVRDDAAPVLKIYYQDGSQAMREIDPVDVITQLNELTGAEGSCTETARSADCAWHAPPRFPDAKSIEVDTRGFRGFELTVQNLAWPEAPADAAALAETGFDPLVPIGDIDLVTPNGVMIGMPLADAHAGLVASGFQAGSYGRGAADCSWQLQRQNEVSIEIKLHAVPPSGEAGRYSYCQEGGIVRDIEFRKTDRRAQALADAPSGADMVAAMNERVGAEGTCSSVDGPGPAQGKITRCQWSSPPPAAGLERAMLQYSLFPVTPEVVLSLTLHGGDSGR